MRGYLLSKVSFAVRKPVLLSDSRLILTVESEPSIDSAGYLTVMNPSIVNQTLLKFLNRLPRVRSDISPSPVSVPQRMREALDTLAGLTGDPTFSGKDAMCPLNFSCVSAEICNIQVKSRESYARNAAQAFSPLQSNGRPIR